MAKQVQLIITCEHGGNRIPAEFKPLLSGQEMLLETHRGYDAGALSMARQLSRTFNAPLFVSHTSRLLVDLNRSIGHPKLFGETVRLASPATRNEILERFYLPYRHAAEAAIAGTINQGNKVIHISSHSFTPELEGVIRKADVGLLYDPESVPEALLCASWRDAFMAQSPWLKIRRNYPYTGKSDGFTAYLRKRFAPDCYVGIELEINQKHVFNEKPQWRALQRTVINTLQTALNDDSLRFFTP